MTEMGGAAVHPPLRAPNCARIRGAIDGGAIKLIKRGSARLVSSRLCVFIFPSWAADGTF